MSRLPILIRLFMPILVLVITIVATETLHACQDEFQKGDIVEFVFLGNEQKSIRKQVASMLKANEVTVGNKAELQLVLSVTKGEQETAEMSSFTDPFGRRGTETIRYRPSIAKAQLKERRRGCLDEGSTLWSRLDDFDEARRVCPRSS